MKRFNPDVHFKIILFLNFHFFENKVVKYLKFLNQWACYSGLGSTNGLLTSR